MISFLLITALTVSIDSFICGFSISLSSKKKYPIVLIIALTVLVMCTITNYLTALLKNFITEETASLGGIILICVGIFNLIRSRKKQNQNILPDKFSFSKVFIIGLAVGLDGALANLSLALMSINEFYVPITIALMHAFMIWLGIVLSNTPFAKKIGKIEFLPPIILILLGGYKLLGLFI